ncbi:hypothetical protein N7510_001846 [Penicillium lagena]|uniref:uncharacterized protein n=1 Tax=Penicillium lagena TaxID=94218 RepID=UPI00253F6522|nr:uncharacterized protein N7510_001846 [Penicillium lagena]KAJ5625537.1 hypothetical protein N7510_001846 [Penicillium lagena]
MYKMFDAQGQVKFLTRCRRGPSCLLPMLITVCTGLDSRLVMRIVEGLANRESLPVSTLGDAIASDQQDGLTPSMGDFG